jgi:putative PIG3 family NAD(P)H quinone oxidoreductase
MNQPNSAALPADMRYIDHGRGGAPEVLVPQRAALPVPGSDEILVRVAYAGVNRPDVLQRSGNYPPPPGASPWLGLEVSGQVAAVGSAVTQWRVGDAVCALTNGGGYAEFVTVPAAQALPVPRGLSLLQAAALPETYFTVWANVFERGRLAAGETLLIHGGSSGIGTTAIQMAKAWGAKVYVTVGSAEKALACTRDLGADHAINYRTHDFLAEVMQLTDKRGVDVILDMVGGDYIGRNLKALALEGRLVQIAFLQTSKVDIDLMPVMIKRLTVTGSTLRARPAADKARLAAELRARIWPHLEQGRMLPVINKVYPLAQAAQAHRHMESSEHIGKLMLEVAGG